MRVRVCVFGGPARKGLLAAAGGELDPAKVRLIHGLGTPDEVIHARTHARTHANARKRTHARTHARARARTHARTHALTHARANTHSARAAQAPDKRPRQPTPPLLLGRRDPPPRIPPSAGVSRRVFDGQLSTDFFLGLAAGEEARALPGDQGSALLGGGLGVKRGSWASRERVAAHPICPQMRRYNNTERADAAL